MLSSKNCWVPHCNASQDENCNRILFPLPKDSKFKETWLALTGKKLISESEVYYCDRHFRSSAFETVMGKIIGLTPRALPYHKMPQMICRTCLSTIPSSAYFCVVSTVIPCPPPKELVSDLVPCRPEALYQILTFCIPEMHMEQNPPALVCIKCYQNIWHYFVFKMQCNAIENQVRGNLTVREFGNAVLCRCCPDRSGSFFTLNEGSQMGKILKNMFLSNFSTNLVPLKVCLKCWNVVYKLAEFHKKCVSMDELLQRYSELSKAQEFYNTQSPQILPTDQNQVVVTISDGHDEMAVIGAATHQKQLPPIFPPNQKQLPAILPPDKKQSTAMFPANKFQLPGNEVPPVLSPAHKMDSVASTSNYYHKSFLKSAVNVSSTENQFSKVATPNAVSGKCDGFVDLTIDDCEVDLPMPVLESQVSQVRDKYETKVVNSPERRKNFNFQSKVILATLVLKHSAIVKPDLNPIEEAKLDLEMWTKIMNELFTLGYSVTLKYVQSVWSRMKIRSKLLRKNMGPMTYLDYLVDVYLTRTGATKNLTDSSSSSLESEGDSGDSNLTEEKKVFETKQLKKRVVHSPGALEDCDVICIDDDPVEENISASVEKSISKNNVSEVQTANSGNTAINNSDSKRKKRTNVIAATKTVIPPRIEVTNDSKPMLPHTKKTGPASRTISKAYRKRGRPKKSEKCPREVWNKEQKLDLVREIRKEYNTLLANNERCLNRASPWKVILERLVSRGYKKCSFSKVYYLWSKMKVSATIYEKNGMDVVDEEVWDLLQFHKDMLEKKDKNESLVTVENATQSIRQDQSTQRSTSPLLKKLKLIISDNDSGAKDSTINYEHVGGEVVNGINTDIHQAAGNEVLSLLKTYRHCKDDKKKDKLEETLEEESFHSALSKDDKLSHNEDQKKLDLISIIRSFGNEVFKSQELSKRMDFWTQATAKFQSKGHDWNSTRIRAAWNNMLHSAKLTWAQEGRTPNVGDQEIIDFMTEVIKEKEMSKNGSKLNLSVEEDDAADDNLNHCETPQVEGAENEGVEGAHNDGVEGAYNDVVEGAQNEEVEGAHEEVEGAHEEVEGVHNDEVEGVQNEKVALADVKREVAVDVGTVGSDSSGGNNVEASMVEGIGTGGIENDNSAYDYVSLDDLKKLYKAKVKATPTILGDVIEITDSDQE